MPSSSTCTFGSTSIPCASYGIYFSQEFADTPVCTATVYGQQSFAGAPVSIVIESVDKASLFVKTGINRPGLTSGGEVAFSLICVQ